MPAPLAKLIPTAVLVAIFGYLSWSYFEEGPLANGPPNNLPKIADDVLRPAAPPETARDPFGDSVRFKMGETSKEKPGGPKKGSTAAAKPLDAAHAASGGPGGTSTSSAGAPHAVIEVKTANRSAPADANLVLNATVLHGNQQLALINGRVYRPGELLDPSNSATPSTVAEIHHHLVVLEREGKFMNLNYSDQPAPSKLGLATQTANGSAKAKRAKSPAPGGPRGSSSPPRPSTRGLQGR